MAKVSLSNLIWFGEAPLPPPKTWKGLKLFPRLVSFRPFGLKVKELCQSTSASEEFRQTCREIAKTVPENLRLVAEKYGIATYPVYDIYEALGWAEALSHDGPRGHGDKFTWRHISGLCSRRGHLVVLAEFVERDNRKYRAENRQGVFNHEFMHCIDEALDMISQKAEFLACVAKDIERINEKLSPSQKAALHYFLAQAPQGPSEIFAECGAARLGECAVTYWTQDFCDWFPSSYEFVSNLVESSAETLLALVCNTRADSEKSA